MPRTAILLTALLGVTAAPVRAHHSVAGSYDTRREIAIDGVIVEFHYVNPHPFLTVDVAGGGRVQRWRLEMDNRSELTEAGFTATTVKPGERIVVRGNPAYGQALMLYIMALERPADGFRYAQVNDSPRILSRPR